MTKQLEVSIFDNPVGYLQQDQSGRLTFSYNLDWLASQDSFPISVSLPLRDGEFDDHACRAYFGGVLPEAQSRDAVAKNLGISRKNDFSLLREIGGECGGAVSLRDPDQAEKSFEIQYRLLTTHELSEILSTLARRPLLAGEDGVRMSLAGAQPKLSVCYTGDQFFLPLNGSASTHILKPAISDLENSAQNEFFCQSLANAIGLKTANSTLHSIGNLQFICLERYDREVDETAAMNSRVSRLHQEDFCQALTILSDHKYQAEGGPSIASCFDLIRNRSQSPGEDSLMFLDGIIFNFFIGNCDAHGKNFSLLYSKYIQSQRLAPLYDLICTRIYPSLSKKMAMKIGGEYDSDKILPHHFEGLAKEVRVSPKLFMKRVLKVGKAILKKSMTLQEASPETASYVGQRTSAILERFAAAIAITEK